jgi:hypothetical protein
MEMFAFYCFFNPMGELVKGEELETQLRIQNELADGAYGARDLLRPPRLNFDSIREAILTVFVLLIGEDWQYVMFNYENAIETSFVQLYFIIVLAIGNFILLSLFTIVLLNNFNDQTKQKIKIKKTVQTIEV